MPKTQKKPLLIRFKDRDTQSHVTRRTVGRLADVLGITETEAVHRALADYARTHLPQYEPDDGPLTEDQHDAIDEMTAGFAGRYVETDSLFDSTANMGKKNDAHAVRPTRRR